MDLNMLRYFVTVADEGSISRAAEVLFLSQPSLSQQIQRLEKEMNTRLFLREARGVALTPAGHLFLRYARSVLEQTANLKAELSFLGEEIAGETRIAAESLSIPLARLYCDFRRLHPHARADFVHLTSVPTPEIVVTTNVLDRLVWSGRELLHEELLIALNTGHPLARRTGLSLEELKDEVFIFSQNREVDRLVTRYCAAAGFVPKVAMECYSMHTVTALVSEGVGVAVLPAYWGAYKPDNVALLPVSGVDFYRTVYLYHPRSARHSRVARAFEEFIMQNIHTLNEKREGERPN
ncbi:MAG: LysR family transcriptional regulator [Candidatus Heritagella sp.]